jgi:NAD-dependent DNA ligase
MDPQKYNNYVDSDEAKGNFSITWTFDIPREKIAEYFQKNGYIFHESPIKTTDFILIGEKAGSKKNKAQELWITIYEWWESIIKEFPFLKTITTIDPKPQVQSLF